MPAAIVQEMRELGLFGLTIPEFGGLELTMEEEVRACCWSCAGAAPAFRSIIGTTVGIGSQGILMDGTDAQAQWLPKLATGEVILFALTEPGPDRTPPQLHTTATIKQGDHHRQRHQALRPQRAARGHVHADGAHQPQPTRARAACRPSSSMRKRQASTLASTTRKWASAAPTPAT